ncbi:S46 peptidase [Aureococcus anophagefferens]|uniref:S46 peptidase n=1 Tax=Aureococcus anophagefferens TaxID=44056 RepID=A0ABR1G326_AURAN
MAASKIASAMGSRFRTWPIGETAALHGELAALGLELPAAAIDGTGPDADASALSNALVSVGASGRGGTGSFISKSGLIVTNHHVALDAVRSASRRAGVDYLEDGFVAKSRGRGRDGELRVLDHAALRGRPRGGEAGGARCEVKATWPERTYTLFVYERLSDVRLVYVPPRYAEAVAVPSLCRDFRRKLDLMERALDEDEGRARRRRPRRRRGSRDVGGRARRAVPKMVDLGVTAKTRGKPTYPKKAPPAPAPPAAGGGCRLKIAAQRGSRARERATGGRRDALEKLTGVYHGSALLAAASALYDAAIESAKPDDAREAYLRERNLDFTAARRSGASTTPTPLEAALVLDALTGSNWAALYPAPRAPNLDLAFNADRRDVRRDVVGLPTVPSTPATPRRRARFLDLARGGARDTPANVLYSTDTLGGNSGSPVLDAAGRFVAINFDRQRRAANSEYKARPATRAPSASTSA